MRVPAVLDRYALSICSADFNEWVKKNTLSKGNTVTIETNIDNTISIYNNYQEEEIKIVFESPYLPVAFVAEEIFERNYGFPVSAMEWPVHN